MQRAQPPDQIHAVDSDHFAPRKYLRQNLQRHAVVGIVEGGNQNQPIRNIEISVTCRQPLAVKDHRPRHRQLDQIKLLAVERARGLEPGEVFGQRRVVRIAHIRLDGGDNRRRPNEAGDVVDVAMRVVAGDAAIEPNHLVDAEKIVKDLLQ